MEKRDGSSHGPPHLAVYLWQNRRHANYNVGPQLERFLDAFLKRDPQEATARPSFLDDPRPSLGDELANGLIRGSIVTRHQSPLSMGNRSGGSGDTLGSEARSVTSQYDDNDEQSTGSGLPHIPEGEEEGPPSPNATESEGVADEVAQKAAEVPRLSPVQPGRKGGGQSWLKHSDACALALSHVTDVYSTLGPEARLLDRRLFQTRDIDSMLTSTFIATMNSIDGPSRGINNLRVNANSTTVANLGTNPLNA